MLDSFFDAIAIVECDVMTWDDVSEDDGKENLLRERMGDILCSVTK